MKKYFVRFGFGIALIVVILLLVAVGVSLIVIENGTVTRFAAGFLVIALLDLALFANMMRRLPRHQEGDEAGS